MIDADPLGLIDRPGRRVIGQLFIAEEIENLGSIGIVDLGGVLALIGLPRSKLTGTVCEHHCRRIGARQKRPKDSDCGPMANPLLSGAQPAPVFERVAAVVDHVGEEALIGPRQLVAGFLGLAFRKGRLRAEPSLDIAPPALDEVGDEALLVERLSRIPIEVLNRAARAGIESSPRFRYAAWR